ncbi:PHP domain-containing protein [Nannocystis pusilla]|uniref:PHP domain-containing protein n=1 Tax=Nannocystis pusilla TaxID=889268 RepID=A0A9X3EJ57_9BACT|nr:PHP domain-containing protein [Nannocystis pusilla]MCY1004997.1 PHP domain-containing protein [Nannocystis pusilla]
MRVDLHCHSTCSDGSLSPTEVATRAQAEGVQLFCLTDHDSVAGYEATAAALPNTRVLRGVELSCRHAGKTVHLLIYGVREGAGLTALQGRLEHVLEDRRTRLKAIIARLRRLGVKLDGEKILIATHGHTPGRPDVARALVEAGVVRSQREAFERYLRDGGPADVALERVSLDDGLRLGRNSGAKMSLAHPHAALAAAGRRDVRAVPVGRARGHRGLLRPLRGAGARAVAERGQAARAGGHRRLGLPRGGGAGDPESRHRAAGAPRGAPAGLAGGVSRGCGRRGSSWLWDMCEGPGPKRQGRRGRSR